MGKVRIKGLRKNYKYKEWLEESLERDKPPLDYFSFARAFKGTESLTNNHYSDLLENLSKDQSNRVIGIALEAKNRFKKRNEDSSFGISYKNYWDERNLQETKQLVALQQQETLVKINKITCDNLVSMTEKLNDARDASGTVGVVSESGSDSDSDSDYSNSHQDSHQEDIDELLKHSAESYTDRVGYMGIIDLASKNVVNMLKEINRNEYEEIMKASTLNDVALSNYAQQVLDAFKNATPSTKSIRTILRTYGNPVDFDIFEHADFGYIEVTTRHFLDLIESPRNPLLCSLQERTTAVYTTTYLLNQLFLSNNDVVELNWIEKEHCTTKKKKWDGVLLLVKDKSISLALMEFSGGVNSNNTSIKEQTDISKLYSDMMKVLEHLPETVKKQVFAVRFFNNVIHFEQLLFNEDKYIRSQHACIECPTTPRLLLDYVKEVPNLMKWKDAIVNHALQL